MDGKSSPRRGRLFASINCTIARFQKFFFVNQIEAILTQIANKLVKFMKNVQKYVFFQKNMFFKKNYFAESRKRGIFAVPCNSDAKTSPTKIYVS